MSAASDMSGTYDGWHSGRKPKICVSASWSSSFVVRLSSPLRIWVAFGGERATLVAMAGASHPGGDEQSTFDWTGSASANGTSRPYRYPKTFYPGVDGPVMPASRLLKNSPPAAGQDSDRRLDATASPALPERRPKQRECVELNPTLSRLAIRPPAHTAVSGLERG
jgi:hypothetical protein